MLKFLELGSIALVIILAIWLYYSGNIIPLIEIVKPVYLLPEFLVGVFSTSALTSPVAVAALFILAQENHPLIFGLVGGLGGTVADLILIKIIRFMLFGKRSPLSKHSTFHSFVIAMHRSKIFNSFAPIVGALFIALPLPDEVGLALLGITNIDSKKIALLSFVLNAAGIAGMAYLAQTLT